MTRLLAAAMLLAAAAPAFACDLEKSVSTDTQKRLVTSQPNKRARGSSAEERGRAEAVLEASSTTYRPDAQRGW
jgi:hypothetical protein